MTQIIENKNKASIQNRIEKNMTGYLTLPENRKAAILIAIFVGILFTVFISEYKIGINYFMLTAVLTASFGYVIYLDNNLSVGKYIFWSIILLSYSSVFFRLSNITYTVLTLSFLPILFIIATLLSSKKTSQNLFVNGIIRLFGSIAFVDKIFIALKSIMSGEEKKVKKTVVKVLIGVGISALLLFMIVPLMFSADAVFKNIIEKYIDLSKIPKLIWKTLLSAVIAILFFGFLYIITVKKDVPKSEVKLKNKAFDFETTLVIVLGAVGFVYTLFAVIQFSYLFGGVNRTLPEGFSITEYARTGYFEQVFMTVINISIIGTSVFFTEKSKGKIKTIINVMLTYFVALNLYLLASSAYKMGIYQHAYGFTVLRLLVDILIIFEAIVFILLAVKIYKRKMKYMLCLIYFTASFWAAVSFINIEGLSADLNIALFENGDEIDIAYMARLDDVSSQMKYLYVEHYDSLGKANIAKIEEYFLNDAENDYKYTETKITLLNKWLEFNISDSKKAKAANEVLKIKNSR
jgi:hypothetical protein